MLFDAVAERGGRAEPQSGKEILKKSLASEIDNKSNDDQKRILDQQIQYEAMFIAISDVKDWYRNK